MADKEIHHYRLTGLSCTNCSAKFEKMFKQLKVLVRQKSIMAQLS